MTAPETSVVIRTFNEEKHLPPLFEALKQQSYQDFELIVVDSGSLDRTRDIAARHADKVLRIDSHDFTFGYSLNVGIRDAVGSYVAVVSAHTIPQNDGWLAALVEPLREERMAMVYGRQLGAVTSKFSETQDFRRTFGRRRRIVRPPRFFANNANSAIRRELWERYPFDETLPGLEDIDWAKYWMERGYHVLYEPAAALYHIHEETWRQVRRRYYREGVAARWIGIKGRGHVMGDAVREAGYALLDFARTIGPSGDAPAAKGRLLQRAREIILFRMNKAIGTARGVLDGAAMQDPIAKESMFFDRACQGVVIHGPGRASLEEVELPAVKPGDMLIRIAYEGVCATDLDIFDGTLGYYKTGKAKYPIVPGHELSGRIVTTGPNVNHLGEGDPVVVECIQSCGACAECHRSNWIACADRAELGVIGRNGGYAEYVVVPGRFVHRLPRDVDLRTACLCEPLAVVLKGLKRLWRSSPPDPPVKRCAVVGAGPLGHLCARVLALRGQQVTVFDRNPLRRSYFERSVIEVSEDLGRLGEFDVLVEVTGDPNALDAMLRRSVPGATILLLGLPYAHAEFTFESIVAYDKTVVGSVGSNAEDFEEALGLLPELDLTSFFEKTLPLHSYTTAWELARRRTHLKVILEVG